MAPLTGLSSLPRELILDIATNLDVASLSHLSRANLGLNNALYDRLKKVARAYAFAPEEDYADAIHFDEQGNASVDENMTFNAPEEPIIKAIQADCVDAVIGFLDAGVNVNAYSINGDRLLYTAAKHRAYQVTQLLLDRGADPNRQNVSAPNTPLIIAAANGDGKLVRKLIRTGADVNGPNVVSAIVHSCNLNTLKFALAHGAILAETTDHEGRYRPRGIPLLHDAAINPNPDILRFMLMVAPESINDTDLYHGRTALWPAAITRNLDAIYTLVEAGIDIDYLNYDGETILHDAMHWLRDTEIPRFLLEQGIRIGIHGQDGMTELHCAAEFGAVDVVRMLLGEGMNVNIRDAQGNTPLHWAAGRDCIAVVKVLVEEGNAVLNYTDAQGNTPMDVAFLRAKHDTWTYLWTKMQEARMRGFPHWDLAADLC